MLKNSSRKSINKPRKFEGPINFIYTEILKISSHIDLFLFFHIFICIFSFYICLWWTWPLFLMYDSTIHLCLRHQWFLILAWDPHNILQIRQGTAPLVKSTEMFEWCSALCHVCDFSKAVMPFMYTLLHLAQSEAISSKVNRRMAIEFRFYLSLLLYLNHHAVDLI